MHCPHTLHAVDKRNNMRATSLCFALTFVLLGASAHANSSDENKYICFDPTKFTASKQVTFNGITKSCDQWIDAAQGSGHVFYGITFNSTFETYATQTTWSVQNGLKMYAGPYGGNGLDCCSDGKSAAFKNYTYFCQDPNDWMPDKTYSGTETGGNVTTCTQLVESISDLNTTDLTTSWSCDNKSSAIVQEVQYIGAAKWGCCGSSKKSACWVDYSNICLDPADYEVGKWYTWNDDDGTSGTSPCDLVLASQSSPGQPFHGIDLSQPWSCDVSAEFRQSVQDFAETGCCGSSNKTACHADPPSANTTLPPPPQSPVSIPPPPPPRPPPKLVTDDDDHAAALTGILVALVATIFNML